MQVILLERVAKLGQMGDVVNVKPGFARNFLLPRGKAVRATQSAQADFDARRAGLEARNAEARDVAKAQAETLDGQSFVMVRSAGESGVLYGSVSARDVAEAIAAGGFQAGRDQVVIRAPIKTLGLHQVPVTLHPEVQATVTINIARSQDEAERQARGESVVADREELDLDALGLEIGAALNEAGPRAEM